MSQSFAQLLKVTTCIEALSKPSDPSEPFVPVNFYDSPRSDSIAAGSVLSSCISIAEKRFQAFCQKPASFNTRPAIPKNIHLIWLGSSPPRQVVLVVDSWKARHPGWHVKLWTDQNLPSFTWSTPRALELFEAAEHPAEQSDILRLEILWQFGGIYSDTDMICLKSFESILARNPCFFTGLEDLDTSIALTSLIGSVPQHPVLSSSLLLAKTAKESPKARISLRTGPLPFTQACWSYLISFDDPSFLFFPPPYFCPLHNSKRFSPIGEILAHVRPESFAIHLWEGSWTSSP